MHAWRIHPKLHTHTSPFQALRSVWHIEVKSILMRTSVAWGGSTWISSMDRGWPGARATAASSQKAKNNARYYSSFREGKARRWRVLGRRRSLPPILIFSPLQVMTFPAALLSICDVSLSRVWPRIWSGRLCLVPFYSGKLAIYIIFCTTYDDERTDLLLYRLMVLQTGAVRISSWGWSVRRKG